MSRAMSGVDRALFWTLAFAVFAAVAAGLAARTVDRMAGAYETERASYAIVRVQAPEGPEGLALAGGALAQAPHVASAAPMTAGRAAALLRQWGGGDVRAQDLPPISLIEVELDPVLDPTADVTGDIVAALAQAGVTADVLRAPDASAGGGASDRIRLAAAWGAGLFALVMALIVSLAARGLAARRRELVTIMADMGATQAQAASRIGDEAAVLGLYAGLTGALLAGAAAMVVVFIAMPDVSLDSLRDIVSPLDLAPLIAAPVVAALAAGFGARMAAGAFHAQAARLG
jgi:cell division transport system permease protein